MLARCSLLLLLLATIVGLTPATARAESIATLHTCAAPARSHDGVATMLRRSARYDCAPHQTRLGAGDFWVRADVHDSHAGVGPMLLRSASVWQRAVTITFVYADGVRRSVYLDDHAAARDIQLGAIWETPVPVRGVPLRHILWRVEGSANIRGIVLGPRLVTPSAAERMNMALGALYAAFGGLCLALLAYNLSLWAALRHKFQLAYCAMVAALAVHAFSSSGALAWLWPELGNTARIRVNYLALAVAAASALAFARYFFEARVFAGRLSTATTAVSVALLGSAAAFALLAPWQARLLDTIYATSFLAMAVLAAAVLVRAWRSRSNYLWMFAFAWAAPIAFAALRVANSFHLVSPSMLLDNSTLAAMALEALISSMAIAYRIRLLMVERDEARAKETAARLLADTDPLTGLLNRRAFLREAIGGEEARMLVLADIDHFKRVNDTLGHDGGDEVLRRIAATLLRIAPAGALVARIGGEEFAILGPADERRLPEHVLERVRGCAMPFDVGVTVSVGSGMAVIATEHDWAALYRDADQALFAAKAAGRDRARWAPLAMAA